MGKKPGYLRTTISVPRDLKRQMDAVKQPVNWSALACRAFEEKLADIATKKEEKTMFDIIQRLRATKPDLIYQQGHADGRRWASERAECEDLLRLERLYERKRSGRDWEKFFDRDYGLPTWEQIRESFSKEGQGKGAHSSIWASVDDYVNDVTIGERLMRILCPHLDAGESGIGDIQFDYDAWRSVCKRFWKSYVGDDDFKVDHPTYVRGFAEGALALWREVKDKL